LIALENLWLCLLCEESGKGLCGRRDRGLI
jgi:hypothetical protein